MKNLILALSIKEGDITDSGIIFATGTTDKKIIALNAINGEEIWSYEMDTSGTAPPIVYTLNGKSYVSVVSSGLTSASAGDNSVQKKVSLKDSTIYTFKLN